MKFSAFKGGREVEHNYGDLFFEEQMKVGSRLVIGPTERHMNLLKELTEVAGAGPWFILYVLSVPRQQKRAAGRYQSGLFETLEELYAVLDEFTGFFEGDGRHHVWVAGVSGKVTLVYDQHDVIFAYGPLLLFKSLLVQRGFSERHFRFPDPHTHHYNQEFDSEEERLMTALHWDYFPLQSNDHW